MKTVLIVGRPNVGKSTLFNRLTRTRAALVDDREGVTRDWIERQWRFIDGGIANLRDLCGFRDDEEDPILQQSQKTMRAMWQDADLVLFVVDGREGVTEVDRWVAQELRNSAKEVVFVANKADDERAVVAALNTGELGWDPIPVSAEHNRGLDELETIVHERLGLAFGETADRERSDLLRVAIVGKPNVGKSTLLNRLLEEERSTVSDIPGTTRDPVDAIGMLGDRPVVFVDTAGIRRKRSISDQLEVATVSRSIQAAKDADIVLYLLHAVDGITQQDQLMLSRIASDGKGVLLLFSHWDRVEDGEALFKRMLMDKERLLPFLDFAPMIAISGLTGHNVNKIARWVDDMTKELDREISTPELNKALQQILAASPPPPVHIRTSRRRKKQKPFKLFYGTQSGTRPLRFKLFANVGGDELSENYHRFLVRRLRERFDIKSVPILLHFENRKGSGA